MERKVTRLLAIWMAVGVMLALLPAVAVPGRADGLSSGTCGSDAVWAVENGTLTISGSGKMEDYDQGQAPWSEQTGSLKSILVGDGITYIGANAFQGCAQTATVSLPQTLTEIGAGAFWGCETLKSISFGGALLTIGARAFSDCKSLTLVTLPESVAQISAGAFSGCEKLAYIEVENPACAILVDATSSDTLGIPGKTVVRGYDGSTAETFADQQGYAFEPFPYTCKYGYHRYTAVLTPPGCTTQGYTTYICDDCGESYRDNFVEPTGHSYEEVVTPPTTTEQGYTTHTCTVCGFSYMDNFVAPHVHSFEAQVVPPTCTEGGYTVHVCTSCGFHYEDDQTEPLGHDWGEWQESGDGWERICSRCGQAEHGEGTLYQFLSGDGQAWKGTGDLLFRLDGDLEKLEALLVDGQAMPVSYYQTDPSTGSLALLSRCLEDLSNGTHTLRLEFRDGSVETAFAVAVQNETTPPHETTESTVPATEPDSSHTMPEKKPPVALWVVLGMVILAAAAVGSYFALKKWKKI